MARLIVGVALLALLLLLAPQPTQAAPYNPAPAPCVVATMAALQRQGYPYVWGAKGPNSFDCSGLTYWAYQQAGINVGVSTYDQAYAGVAISCNLTHLAGASTTCWAPGDLAFLSYSGGQHVAIYAGDGLFMDCYSPAVGCVLHDVTADSFYAAHFWQARRIVTGCESLTVDPGTPIATPPSAADSPDLESIPDLVSYVSFVIPPCESWWQPVAAPANPEDAGFIGSALYPFEWLGWVIGDMARQSTCAAVGLAQYGANFLTVLSNGVLEGINGLWRMGVFAWLGTKLMFLALWGLWEDFRSGLANGFGSFAYVQAAIRAVMDVLVLVLDVVLQIAQLVLRIGLALLGLLGWIAGLLLGALLSVLAMFDSTSVPSQLQQSHVIYQMLHGFLRGLRDSKIGWLLIVLWGMAYVSFFFWVASLFSSGREV
jgi:hypothetical protein